MTGVHGDGPHGLLLFDFDGTLYRGDDPFHYYAERIAEALPVEARDGYLARTRHHLAGERLVDASDNWEAMVRLMAPHRVDRARLQEAFDETRRFMMTDACRLEVPTGLHQLLDEAERLVVRAVASNSPEVAAIPLLDKLGLLRAFDEVRHSSRKPEGMGMLVEGILKRYGLADGAVLSIGDHYVNDIAPGIERGWQTIHISPRGEFPGPATHRGRRLEDVMPQIRQWVRRQSGMV